jgi:transposase-like protein
MPVPPRSAQQWAPLVAELQNSHLSIAAFAAQKGVHPATLATWRRRFAQKGPAFLEVSLAEQEATLQVELPSRAVIRVPVGTNLRWLRQVVEALS